MGAFLGRLAFASEHLGPVAESAGSIEAVPIQGSDATVVRHGRPAERGPQSRLGGLPPGTSIPLSCADTDLPGEGACPLLDFADAGDHSGADDWNEERERPVPCTRLG